MSLWSSIRSVLGLGATTAASAPLGGIPAAVTAGARAVTAVTNGITEANRAATLRAIAAELHKNADAIDAAIAKANGITPPAVLLLAGLLALGAMGCASAPPRDDGVSTGNVARLLARPDFAPAAKAAPEWCRDALKTVNSLEGDLQVERTRANQVR